MMGAAGERPGVRHALAALALAGLALYYWLGQTSAVGGNYDDLIYLVTGKALAEGHGYRVISQPGAPFQIAYPPLYPALLAVVWKLVPAWPANVAFFKLVNVAAALSTVVGLYRLVAVSYGEGRRVGLLVAAVAATSGGMLLMIDLTMSEHVYMAASTWALVGIEAVLASQDRGVLWRGLGLGACVAVVMMTRSFGVSLACAVGAWLLFRREWRLLASYAGFLVLLNLPWQLWVAYLKHAHAFVTWDYLGWIGASASAERFVGAFANALLVVIDFTFPNFFMGPVAGDSAFRLADHLHLMWLRHGILAGCVLMVAGGLVASAVRRPRVLHLYAFFGGLLGLSYFWDPTRFYSGLVPVWAYGLVRGCLWVASWRLPGYRAIAYGVLAVALVGLPMRLAGMARHHAMRDALLPAGDVHQLENRRAFAAWAIAHTPPDALFYNDRDPLIYLDTGRESVGYFDGPRPSAATRAVLASRPCYLVLSTHKYEVYSTLLPMRAMMGPARQLYADVGAGFEVYALPRRWEYTP